MGVLFHCCFVHCFINAVLKCHLTDEKLRFAPAPFLCMFFPISAADPFLRRWEGGISGRGGVSGTASSGAGANSNCETKSAVRRSGLTVRVTARVTARLTEFTVTLTVRLDVTFHVTLVGADYWSGNGSARTGGVATGSGAVLASSMRSSSAKGRLAGRKDPDIGCPMPDPDSGDVQATIHQNLPGLDPRPPRG